MQRTCERWLGREKESERERVCVCLSVCLCARERERERVNVTGQRYQRNGDYQLADECVLRTCDLRVLPKSTMKMESVAKRGRHTYL